VSQRGVLGDQSHGAGPGRQRVDGLDQGEPEQCPDRIARATHPAGRFKLGDQPGYLRAVQQCGDLLRVGCTVAWAMRGNPLVQTPGRANVAGVTLFG
jgi:hypothetical protein